MTLKKKKYKSYDAVWLAFEASPVCMLLYVILPVTQSIMQTAITAVATAYFVDTATAILNNARPYEDIWPALALVLITLGFVNTMGAVSKLTASRVSVRLQRMLKPAVVKITAALDYKHIENEKSWELISRVSRDPVTAVTDGVAAFIQFAQIIVSIISVFALIVSQVWWAALVIVLFSVPLFVLSMRAGKKNYQAGRDAEKFNRRTEYLGEVLTGRENVDERTLFGYYDEVSRVWKEQYEAGRKLQVKVTARNFMISKGSSMLLALIALLVALTLVDPVVRGQMSAGMFMGIVSAVFGMIQKLGFQLSRSLENISRVGEYMKDLGEFVRLSEAEDALTEPDMAPVWIDSLEFRNVRFRYPNGGEYILDGLSFKLEAGHHYAFVGKNGAGKTTITKLLTGLYTDYEGEILVNGKELRRYTVSAVKAMFSVVYQDFAKYYIEMKDNIALGNIHATGGKTKADHSAKECFPLAEERAACLADQGEDYVTEEGAVHLAGLDEVVSRLENGINTPLGKILKGGQDISGGQWQRVAIARGLYRKNGFIVLDEPTSAIDPIEETRIYKQFARLAEGKCALVVTHRIGSAKLADRIIVMDAGEIVDMGTHEELITRPGQYARMWEAQAQWYERGC